MKKSYFTLTDQFCGAGGTAQGVRKVSEKYNGGIEITQAMNHWKLALETHNTNFPDTNHFQADISSTNPRKYESTHVLTTSPECTNQTGANGKKKPTKQIHMFDKQEIKPEEERSRATMWDVPRFAEVHKYELILVENVVEAIKWIMFDAWLMAMHSLGYKHKLVFRNSMHFQPCPQSRDRLYFVFWKKGNPEPDLDYRPKAFCPCCDKDVNAVQAWKPKQKTYKYRTGYVYVCPNDGMTLEPYYTASFNIIDWSNPGRRIGDFKLCANTIKRIEYGRKKFWSDPQFATDVPIITKGEYSSHDGYARSCTLELYTQSTRQTFGVLIPPKITSGFKSFDFLPFLAINKGQSTARESSRELSTITTTLHHGIVSPEAFHSFLTYYNGKHQASYITDAMGTIPTVQRLAICNWNKPDLEDCYYRTLKAHEVKLGMAFDSDYVVLGDQKQQVIQCGNAVTPPVMEWLFEQSIKTLM